MKTIILLSIAIFLCVTACKKEEKADYIVISGKIEHPNSDSLFVISQSGTSLQSIALQKDHSFSDTLIVKDGYYMLSDGKEQAMVYLKKGYTIRLKLDAEKFDESLSYEGVGAPENNYLAKKTLKEEAIRKVLESYFMAK